MKKKRSISKSSRKDSRISRTQKMLPVGVVSKVLQVSLRIDPRGFFVGTGLTSIKKICKLLKGKVFLQDFFTKGGKTQ